MKIEVYTMEGCTYCQQCIDLLANNHVEHIQHSSTAETLSETFKILKQRTGVDVNFMPVVFIDDEPIGAYDALKERIKEMVL